ncbi:MAG TPA: hypothetical protein VI685_11320, partial [Candidatus Angelobacter sp.]
MIQNAGLQEVYENLFADFRSANYRKAAERIKASPILNGWNPQEQGIANNALYLKLHAVIASVYDGIGDFDEASKWIEHQGSDVKCILASYLLKLKQAVDGDVATDLVLCERDLLFARSWFVLRYAVSAYRRSDFAESLSLLDMTGNGTRSLIRLDESRAEWLPGMAIDSALLLASVHYWRGCSLVYTKSLEEAEKCFIDALKIVVEQHQKPPKGSLFSEEQLNHADYLCGRILLGLGLAKFRQGAFTSAKSHLLAARTLLARAGNDSIRIKRAELLLLSVERITVGDDGETLYKDVILPLQQLLCDFQEHKAYRRRTLWTLAHAYISLSDCQWKPTEETVATCLEKAAMHIYEALELCDPRTLTDLMECLLLQARILRKQGRSREALEKTRTILAGKKLGRWDVETDWELYPFYRTQVLIAVGQAQYKLALTIEKDKKEK